MVLEELLDGGARDEQRIFVRGVLQDELQLGEVVGVGGEGLQCLVSFDEALLVGGLRERAAQLFEVL